MPDALRRHAKSFVHIVDATIERVGAATAWLVVLMVAITVFDVVMRYGLKQGSVALQEMEWHLFAALFLLAAAYTLKHDGHVRVDLLYRSRFFGPTTRKIIDVMGILCFLIPFCGAVIMTAWPFVLDAYQHSEHSPDPGGLPYRWIIKFMILLGFALLLLQGFANLLRTLLSTGRD